MLAAVKEILIGKFQGDLRPGQAPKGGLERKIAKNLELLAKKKLNGQLLGSLLDDTEAATVMEE